MLIFEILVVSFSHAYFFSLFCAISYRSISFQIIDPKYLVNYFHGGIGCIGTTTLKGARAAISFALILVMTSNNPTSGNK